ncbi:MAG: hypothetical protein JKY37_01380 [Nannocystaceae bacterium]|nr:hypothetical protein [Nannocystaceae bacterium]
MCISDCVEAVTAESIALIDVVFECIDDECPLCDDVQDAECDACEAEALGNACAEGVLECEADVAEGGCAELTTCVEACADGDRSECLDTCFSLADESAVSLLDDVFVCVAEACFLC